MQYRRIINTYDKYDVHTDEEYSNFDKTLGRFFDLWDIETKEDLANYMYQAGFHTTGRG